MLARTPYVLLLHVALPGMCIASAAGVSLDEGREIAEAHAPGGMLEDAPSVSDRSGWQIATYSGINAAGETVRLRVRLDDGAFLGWTMPLSGPPDVDLEHISEQEALQIAKQEASRHLGSDADGLAFEVTNTPPADVLVVRGRSAPAGDPPRTGIGPEVTVDLLGRGGQIYMYQQSPGEEPVDASDAISEAEALEAARQAVSAHYQGRELQELGITHEDTSLSQFRGELTYYVTFSGGPNDEVVVSVDAMSGEVDTVSPAEGVATPTPAATDEPGPAPPTPGHQPAATDPEPAGMQPLTIAGIGVGVIALLALGVVLVRWRGRM
ncbi:MAG: hypothetical protein GF320_22055 [Armatimonadia bacterium]|nr:hypothetical protein [Armatimonadia bacterium]